MPLDADLVVVLSGVVEIALGAGLALLPRYRVMLGWVTAAFFVAVFPGNISQFVDGDAAFGLDSDTARAVRLLFQPVLVALALWSTGVWTASRSGSIEAVDATGRRIPIDRLEAVIFDVDGVVTQTASVHAAAWKATFDSFLRAHAEAESGAFVPFTDDDYRSFVDGMSRFDGVSRFLASRGISLPFGEPGDPPDRDTVCGLGNRKNADFLAEVENNGVAAFESTAGLLADLRAIGVPTAAVSASENAGAVLEGAGVAQFFDVRVDGLDASALGLAGKPDPAIFLEAARRLDAEPSRSAVVEDALAGVAAGRGGGFGLVVGVDRTGHPDDLVQGGADVVVSDLAELVVSEGGRWSVAR